MANPAQVREFFPAARAALGDDVELTAHFHNTRGQGLANVLAALDAGVRSFESSFGELGGCPVPRGATGNIATEDLVSMLHEMGIETGIDLGLLLEAARAARDVLGRPLIVMCNEGYQSSLVAATLQELGHGDATDLDGGFQAWKAAGLPVAPLDPNDRTSV